MKPLRLVLVYSTLAAIALAACGKQDSPDTIVTLKTSPAPTWIP